jgi:4-alpha-glucanotransferase
VRLFGDLPIYIALDSVDAWVHNELLLLDADGQPTEVAGVPPDYFSEDGQLWGNPLYDWDYHEATGFGWWIERMRHAMTLCDMVRIDHFRGFESYWAVPASAETARGGEWRKGPADKIFDAMRDKLGVLPIVAEDLGIITDEVDALRERQQFPGMKVLQFLIGEEDFAIEDIPEDCVCYTGTHDNDTTAGWFQGGSGDLRSDSEISAIRRAVLALTDGREDTVARDLVRLALASPARIAMAPMQDYLDLGSTARFNTPGTTDHNWRWRLHGDALNTGLAELIRAWIADAGRGRAAMLQS